MARIDQSDNWQDRHAPTISTFESLAMEAYSHLPEEFRALTTNLTIEIEDFPDDDVFEDMALETPFDLLGLFEGRGISERFTMETGELPNRIRLYRRPILDYWAENDETLGDIITHVLIHEIGHHFGLSTTTWSGSRPAPKKPPSGKRFGSIARRVSCRGDSPCPRRA
jgi:predicted Zn-dependent protease with MMP-like domain